MAEHSTVSLEQAPEDRPLGESRCRPAAVPLAPAGASYAAAALAVLLIAVGAVCLRDTAVQAGLVGGEQWLPLAVKAVDGLQPSIIVLAVTIAAGVVGILLTGLAVKPRRATAVPARGDSGGAVYVRLRDVAQAAATAARDVPGVEQVDSTATARKVSLRCVVSVPEIAEIRHLVARAVRDELQPLARPPRITVRVRQESRR
ncbi:DUF6286 domain-containing protein [Mycolicibacterium sp. ELW1]|uniref:DUF6286 domain-containing protein n=1 Tax=Mycobacteriaceae TaxID=1762 RepID=UPI0011EC8531|nr:DUF6286 domain-containing protein [Mycobacterium sp. ELW1]QEN12033.1 hypothetical protein D3H54_01090 [Mycobacterium sp. ELW1]